MPKKVTPKKEDELKNVVDLRQKKNATGKPSTKKIKKSRFPWKIIVSVFAGLIIVINIIFAYGIYGLGWTNKPTEIFVKIFPYPAARANWNFISLGSYYKDLSSYMNYYKVAQSVDFTTEEGAEIFNGLKSDLLDLLVEEKIIEKEAKKYDIKVEDSEVDEEYNKLKEESGEETLKKQIEEYYMWDVATFKGKIRSALLRKKLEEKISEDESLSADAKSKAEEVLTKAKAGEDFAELAKEYSEDPSAGEGGSLGWFAQGTMVKEFEDAAFALNKGAISDVIKTQYGYHIIKVEDKKESEIYARHILIKGVDFTEWLENKKSEYSITKFLDVSKIKP